jgi:hypothetical protein
VASLVDIRQVIFLVRPGYGDARPELPTSHFLRLPVTRINRPSPLRGIDDIGFR